MSPDDEDPQEPRYVSLHDATYVTGVAIMGIIGQIAGRPAVVFRFRDLDGKWCSTMVFVSDPDYLRELPPMAQAAVDAATRWSSDETCGDRTDWQGRQRPRSEE